MNFETGNAAQNSNLESITSSTVPITFEKNPDVQFNQNRILQKAAEDIKKVHEILPPVTAEEFHQGRMQLKAEAQQLEKPIIYEPMGLDHNYDKLLRVDDAPLVTEHNDQNLMKDHKYYSDYYAQYFQKYYQKLKGLYNPIAGANANQASSSIQDIFKYFPIMYNQNYNDNLLAQQSTLYRMDDLSKEQNPYMTPCECIKGKVPCDCPLRARTIVMPIVQPIIEQVPLPPMPECEEETCEQDCGCDCEEQFFFRFKMIACQDAPPPPEGDDEDDDECKIERPVEPKKCKCEKTCKKKCGMTCAKYMRLGKKSSHKAADTDEAKEEDKDGDNESGDKGEKYPLQVVSVENHNLEHALSNINTVDRVTKDTKSDKKIVKNIQNFYTLKFKSDDSPKMIELKKERFTKKQQSQQDQEAIYQYQDEQNFENQKELRMQKLNKDPADLYQESRKEVVAKPMINQVKKNNETEIKLQYKIEPISNDNLSSNNSQIAQTSDNQQNVQANNQEAKELILNNNQQDQQIKDNLAQNIISNNISTPQIPNNTPQIQINAPQILNNSQIPINSPQIQINNTQSELSANLNDEANKNLLTSNTQNENSLQTVEHIQQHFDTPPSQNEVLYRTDPVPIQQVQEHANLLHKQELQRKEDELKYREEQAKQREQLVLQKENEAWLQKQKEELEYEQRKEAELNRKQREIEEKEKQLADREKRLHIDTANQTQAQTDQQIQQNMENQQFQQQNVLPNQNQQILRQNLNFVNEQNQQILPNIQNQIPIPPSSATLYHGHSDPNSTEFD